MLWNEGWWNADIEDFNKRLTEIKGQSLYYQLKFIVGELLEPWKDIRESYYMEWLLTLDKDISYMLIGETPETFYEGQVILGEIKDS